MADLRFNTIYGRNLVAELKNIVQRPYVVVTMEDLWDKFKDNFDEDAIVYIVKTLEYDEIMKNIAFSRFNREHGDVMAKLKTIDGAKMVYKLKGQLEYEAFEKMLDSIVTAGCEN